MTLGARNRTKSRSKSNISRREHKRPHNDTSSLPHRLHSGPVMNSNSSTRQITTTTRNSPHESVGLRNDDSLSDLYNNKKKNKKKRATTTATTMCTPLTIAKRYNQQQGNPFAGMGGQNPFAGMGNPFAGMGGQNPFAGHPGMGGGQYGHPGMGGGQYGHPGMQHPGMQSKGQDVAVDWDRYNKDQQEFVEKDNRFDPATRLYHKNLPKDNDFIDMVNKRKPHAGKGGPYGRLHRDGMKYDIRDEEDFRHGTGENEKYPIDPNSVDPRITPPPGFVKYTTHDGTWVRGENEKSDHEPYFTAPMQGPRDTSYQLTRPDRRRRVYTWMQYDPVDHIHFKNQRVSYMSQQIWFWISRFMDTTDMVVRSVMHVTRPWWILTKIVFRLPEFTFKFLLQLKIEAMRYIERRWGPPEKRDPNVYKFVPGMWQAVLKATKHVSDYIERWGTRDPEVGAWLKKTQLLDLNEILQDKAFDALENLQRRHYEQYAERKKKKLEAQRAALELEHRVLLEQERVERAIYHKFFQPLDHMATRAINDAETLANHDTIREELRVALELSPKDYVAPSDVSKPFCSIPLHEPRHVNTKTNQTSQNHSQQIAQQQSSSRFVEHHYHHHHQQHQQHQQQQEQQQQQQQLDDIIKFDENNTQHKPSIFTPKTFFLQQQSHIKRQHNTLNTMLGVNGPAPGQTLNQMYSEYLKNNPKFRDFYYKAIFTGYDLEQIGIHTGAHELIKLSRTHQPEQWDQALIRYVQSFLITHPHQYLELHDIITTLLRNVNRDRTKNGVVDDDDGDAGSNDDGRDDQDVAPYLYNTKNANPFYHVYYQQTRQLWKELQKLNQTQISFEQLAELLDQPDPQTQVSEFLYDNVKLYHAADEQRFYDFIDTFPQRFAERYLQDKPAERKTLLTKTIPSIIANMLPEDLKDDYTESHVMNYIRTQGLSSSVDHSATAYNPRRNDIPNHNNSHPPQQRPLSASQLQDVILGILKESRLLDIPITHEQILSPHQKHLNFNTIQDILHVVQKTVDQPEKFKLLHDRTMLKAIMRYNIPDPNHV